MLEITLDETPVEKLILRPENRVTKGVAAAPMVLEGWVSLGQPVVVPITKSKTVKDEELRRFVEGNKGAYRYFLVHLSCSFNSPANEPFSKAWVKIILERRDHQRRDLPIAWSMQPDRLADEIEYSTTAQLGTQLKLSPVTLSAGLKDTTKLAKKDTLLLAFNELQSDPLWEFQQTQTAAIRGKYRLVLVVQSPADVQALGTVRLSANVKRKGWLRRYEDAFPSNPQRSFSMG